MERIPDSLIALVLIGPLLATVLISLRYLIADTRKDLLRREFE